MKILFILNQLPYPPRSGVTIPSYNYIRGLAARNEVSLLYLRDPAHEAGEKDIENRALVRELWVTVVTKLPAGDCIARELPGNYFFHIGRRYDREFIESIFKKNEFDAVWISDDGIPDVADVVRDYSGTRAPIVAAINDCITEVFKQSITQVFLKSGSIREKIGLFIKWLRSLRAGPIENAILSKFDKILVQSDSDRKALEKISDHTLDENILVLSNGVERELFAASNDLDGKNLVFVGSLRGYSRIVELLLEDVWPAVKSAHPEAIFHVVGRGASPALREKMARQQDVRHVEFVDDVVDIYRGKAVSISPVFKNYGLINKVIESMAAGVPVVADRGSFGCIPEFIDGRHGMVANDAQAMISAIDGLLCSGKKRRQIAAEARELVRKHFDWNDRIETIQSELRNELARREQPGGV